MTVYAVPTSLAEFQTLINGISWPLDCVGIAAAAADLTARLEAITQGWTQWRYVRLHVVSTTPPTLVDWQTAWKDQGRLLPITGRVLGLWENGAGRSADYIWYNEEMQPMMAYWWNGSVQFIESVPTDYTNTAALSTTDTTLITEVLPLDRPAWIQMSHALSRGVDTTTTIQYKIGSDVSNYTRGLVAPNDVSTSPRIGIIDIRPSAKVSSGSLTIQMRTVSGTGTVLFTNTAQTRKIETGFYPHFLGDTNTLMTEVIYL